MTLPRPDFDSPAWQKRNQRDIAARVENIKIYLERILQSEPDRRTITTVFPHEDSAISWLARAFNLSSFETDLLMLCAAVEMDSGIASLCAEINGDLRKCAPTFGLALTVLHQPHWSALAPISPLRRWRFITVLMGDQLTRSPLAIDERILHFIAGIEVPDSQLQGFVRTLPIDANLTINLGGSNNRLAHLIHLKPAPVITVICMDRNKAKEVTGIAAKTTGKKLFLANIQDIPPDRSERYNLAQLIERECLLTDAVMLLEDDGDSKNYNQLSTFISDIECPVIILCDSPIPLKTHRKLTRLSIEPHKHVEQRTIWHHVLEQRGYPINGYSDRLSTHFRLSSNSIYDAVEEAFEDLEPGVEEHVINERLWDACRRQAQPSLSELAQRIETCHTWEDIVLPEMQKEMLRAIVTHVEQRYTVYESWGYGLQTRGIGTSVIFAGGSGTGKTMAAEIVAATLRLDLYRIDLSAVVSKYIGETEKNLRRIFSAAEQGGAILLFDEADALFGKRSEVRDSHDRYANLEVSYLLQQMEAYRGLAILTTNMLDNFDRAFLRRVRFVVQFPFPTAEQRQAIWRRVFPEQAPVSGLDFNKLSRLNVTGGNIRNIALNAAFLAAGRQETINMKHLLRSATSEYAKLEKPLPDAEIRDWWRHDA